MENLSDVFNNMYQSLIFAELGSLATLGSTVENFVN